jgi:hypothetical protein
MIERNVQEVTASYSTGIKISNQLQLFFSWQNGFNNFLFYLFKCKTDCIIMIIKQLTINTSKWHQGAIMLVCKYGNTWHLQQPTDVVDGVRRISDGFK